MPTVPGLIPRLCVLAPLALTALCVRGAAQESGDAPPFREELVVEQRRDFKSSLGGWIALDLVNYGHSNERDSGAELDTADLLLDLDLDGALRLHVRPDLIGVDTPRNLREAWVATTIKGATLRAGLLPMGLSRERAVRPEDREILGHAFPESLEGRTDVGLTVEGISPARWLELGAELGIGEGFGLEGRRRDAPRGALYGRARPWSEDAGALLHGLWVGGGLAWQSDFDDPLLVTTPTESVVFTTPDLGGDSGLWSHWELGWRSGPVSLQLERLEGAANDVPLPGGGQRDFDQLTAYSASMVVRVSLPAKWKEPLAIPFGPAESEEGRGLLLGARYSNADIDRGLFDAGLATYDPSTQEVRTFTASVGLTDFDPCRVSLNYVKTIADHELGTFGGSNRDSTFVLRIGVKF